MAELPRGTVTFVFTDIEGSTRLLKTLGPPVASEARKPGQDARRLSLLQATVLILDYFEQVMAAAGEVSSLVTSSPLLKIVVTSREALRIEVERELSPRCPGASSDSESSEIPGVACGGTLRGESSSSTTGVVDEYQRLAAYSAAP